MSIMNHEHSLSIVYDTILSYSHASVDKIMKNFMSFLLVKIFSTLDYGRSPRNHWNIGPEKNQWLSIWPVTVIVD